MTQTNTPTNSQRASLSKNMIVGAGIGLLVILTFIIPARENPAWGELWMIRPLIVTPLAGAMGGLCKYFIVNFHYLAGINKTVAVVISMIIFLVGLWLGVVLGLDGTMWN